LSGAGPETVQAAYSQFLAAQNGYQAYMSLIDDATIYSDVDGSVVSILYETSEAVPAGYPAVIVSSRQLLIQTSVTRSDLQRLSLITPCEVVVNDQIYEGVIQEINRFPDENKLTYPVSIMVVDPPNDLLVGDLASIRFLLEEVNGIWLDIMTISNDGSDFVFVVENNRVTKRSIEILSVMNDKVLVDGLNVGDEVIVKGFNQVRIGSVVDVQQ
jgi:multidrug efflux pump subunit AcrA (membrane-fusion protein)